tara:strand:+ start:322 stop:555 length:234 start_codon:yes stop_codon:yes gene_type:complete
MKKIIFIFLIVFYSGSLCASEMNKLLDQNNKIIKTELIKFNQDAYKIFTLKNGKNIFICSVKLEDMNGLIGSECIKP